MAKNDSQGEVVETLRFTERWTKIFEAQELSPLSCPTFSVLPLLPPKEDGN